MLRLGLGAFIVFFSLSAHSEDIQIQHNGLTLNGNLLLAEDQTLEDGLIILTHGTLAHNKMDLVDTFQSLFVEYGVSTLAINLSLGIDDRPSQMYDCAIPARHSMEDAIDEISAWQNWLDAQNAGPRYLMGHSRGGNQTAQYVATEPDKVDAQILLAPATWDYESTIASYSERYGMDIEALLAEQGGESDDQIIEDVSILYCENSGAQLGSLRSYYANNPAYDTPTLLQTTTTPTIVIAGSLDEVVADLPEKMAAINREDISLMVVEDADHFFLDLFADEAVEYVVDFIEAL